MIYKLGDNSVQTAGDDFFIAPSASVMGRVFLEKHVSVWFGAVIRGDVEDIKIGENTNCLLYTSPSPRDLSTSRMPSSA